MPSGGSRVEQAFVSWGRGISKETEPRDCNGATAQKLEGMQSGSHVRLAWRQVGH